MTGFIERTVKLIRMLCDEPETDAKYSEADLITFMEAAFQTVLADLNATTDAPIMVRHTITLGSDAYVLPPSVEQIVRIAKLNDDLTPEYQFVPRPAASWYGPSFRLEGRVLRIDPKWEGNADAVEVMYIPNGDFRLHQGTPTSVSATGFTLAGTPTKGEVDLRDNAYVGAVVRIWNTSNECQERTVTAFNNSTKVITVMPDFSPVPSGTMTYEVIPVYGRHIEMVVAHQVAETLLAAAGNTTRHQLVARQLAKYKRGLLIQLSRMQNIIGDAMSHRTLMGEVFN